MDTSRRKNKNLQNNEYDPVETQETYPCKICGRNFINASLSKHKELCKKLTKKRRVFQSGKQRAVGADVNIQGVRRAAKEKEKNGGVFPRPKTHWREKHDQFIDAISSSKQVDFALKTGTPLPPPPRAYVPSDYVKCQYCDRNFNSTAAERHIPFCKERISQKIPRTEKNPAKIIPLKVTPIAKSSRMVSQVNRGRPLASNDKRPSSVTRKATFLSRPTANSAEDPTKRFQTMLLPKPRSTSIPTKVPSVEQTNKNMKQITLARGKSPVPRQATRKSSSKYDNN